ELVLGVVQHLADRRLRNVQGAGRGTDRSGSVDGAEDINLAKAHALDLRRGPGGCHSEQRRARSTRYSGERPVPSRRGSAAHSKVPSRRNTPCRPESSPGPDRTSTPRRASASRISGAKRAASPSKRLPRATKLGRSTACCWGRSQYSRPTRVLAM